MGKEWRRWDEGVRRPFAYKKRANDEKLFFLTYVGVGFTDASV